MSSGTEKAHDYREGFYEGAKAVMKAIGDDLPDNQMRVLEAWIEGPLSEWRRSDDADGKPPTPLLDGA